MTPCSSRSAAPHRSPPFPTAPHRSPQFPRATRAQRPPSPEVPPAAPPAAPPTSRPLSRPLSRPPHPAASALRQRERELKRLAQPLGLEVTCCKTSIWDETLYRAWSAPGSNPAPEPKPKPGPI